MTDLRTFNDTIKTAVAREREADANWSWNIKAINKGSIKIGWGYLDYIGEKESFTVEVTDGSITEMDISASEDIDDEEEEEE